jgi:hypothetical protein
MPLLKRTKGRVIGGAQKCQPPPHPSHHLQGTLT